MALISGSKTSAVAIRAAGATLIVLSSFFGALYILNSADPDITVRKNASAVAAALERYYQNQRAYPVLPQKDVTISELTTPLARSGHIASIPADIPGIEPIRYYSPQGQSYGLLLRFKAFPPCKVTLREIGKAWWGVAIPYCLDIVK